MKNDDIGAILRAWRKSSGFKQSRVAEKLGVTQAAVSRWENGLDIPSPSQYVKLRALVGNSVRSQIDIECSVIERQVGVRAIVDLDGIRLQAASESFRALWPELMAFRGVPLADYLTGLTRDLYHNFSLMNSIRRNEVALVSGVSDQHLEGVGGKCVRHRWSAIYRKIGTRRYSEISYEACAPDEVTGLRQLLHIDEIA